MRRPLSRRSAESSRKRLASHRLGAAKWVVLVLGSGLLAFGCEKAPPEPSSRESSQKASAAPLSGAASSSAATSSGAAESATAAEHESSGKHVGARPVASVTPSPDDPLHGKFTLADATKGLSGSGPLEATIDTSMGALQCRLFDDKAPITVANFVGLARGIRPWKDPSGEWVKKPAYDGTVFHRIIKGFMIQGGDAKGNGSGEPGYVIPDEVWENASHDRAGLLCMANRGPNTNGAQFFITDAPALHLNSGYTIFGECGPIELIHKLASVEVRGDRPVNPPKIKDIKVKRTSK